MSCSVIVVGAGTAGLVAAYDVKMQSACNVTVLEASSVHGGRLKKDDQLADFPIDLGGEWIESASGRAILDEIVNDASVNITVETFPFALPTFEWFEIKNKMAQVTGPLDFGLHFKNSTWYDFITDYIFSALDPSEVVVSCQVKSIDYSDVSSGLVQVDSTCGTFQADRVVVAVPLTVMQDGDIEFNPPLPKAQQKVLDSVDMPAGVKVFLRFTEAFYPPSFSIFSDLIKYPDFSPRYFYNETSGQHSTDNIMGVFSYGESAEKLYADLSNVEIFQSVMATLDGIFDGQASANIEDYVVQNWAMEPFIRGAYSFQTPDKSLLLKIMQKPLNNRVYFAGEYLPDPTTNDGNGSVHNAALSGRYAVSQFLDSLQRKLNRKEGV
jgi:monoamine oxidase